MLPNPGQDPKFPNIINHHRLSKIIIGTNVPRGALWERLSLHLFSVYINDMLLQSNFNTTLFADDTYFYASWFLLHSVVKKIKLISPNNGSTCGKSQFILRKPLRWCFPTSLPPTLLISWDQRLPINWSSAIIYLDIHVDSQWCYWSHILFTNK